MTWNIYLKGHNAGVRAIFVDLIHGSLQSYSLLREILQILRTLLCLFMGLAHLTGGKKTLEKNCFITTGKVKVYELLWSIPGSYKWCNPPSRAVVQSGTQPCSHKLLQPNDDWKNNKAVIIQTIMPLLLLF